MAQGFGIALVADVDAIHRDDICIRHLVSHESFSHTVYMGYMTGKYQLPAIKRFIEFVRKAALGSLLDHKPDKCLRNR